VANADGTGQTRLTNAKAIDRGPVWSPDGSKVAFEHGTERPRAIYTVNADGSGLVQLTRDEEAATTRRVTEEGATQQ
jgi:TolB protein